MTRAENGNYEAVRLALFGASVGVAIVASHLHVAGMYAVPLALAAIAVGIWHGAFDGVLAEQALQPRLGRGWKLPFYGGYLAAAATVALIWWTLPVVALSVFLLYSAFHFGTEGQLNLSPARLISGACLGAVPIAASCHWWPRSVSAIFLPMLQTGHAGHASGVSSQLAHAAGVLLWPAVAVVLVRGWLDREDQGLAPVVLVLLELLLFRLCSPVPAFAVFFCAWHTPEHLVDCGLDASGTFQPLALARLLRAGTIPWLLSLAVVGLVGWTSRHDAAASAGVVFIALSALTVPHMLLAELCRRQHVRPARCPSSFQLPEASLTQ